MDKIQRDSFWQYAWLLTGGILMIFYNGNAVSIAAWLAPLFVLRFTRISRGKVLFLVLPVLAISHALV